MSTRIKIGKQILAKVIKESFMENGYNEKDAVYISENVIRRLDEMGPRTAALTQGSNYNAEKQSSSGIATDKNWQKIKHSNELKLPVLNHAILKQFPNLELLFLLIHSDGEAIALTFHFNEITNVRGNRIVIGGNFQQGNGTSKKGSIEYNVDTTEFLLRSFYGLGAVLRTCKIQLYKHSPADMKTTNEFINFITKYVQASKDYQNNVNNAQ